VFDPVLSFNMRVYRGVVSGHLGKLISAVSIRFPSQHYWFTCQLVPVIFTYLRADCPCDVTKFLDLTSFRLPVLTGSGRVMGQKS